MNGTRRDDDTKEIMARDRDKYIHRQKESWI